MRYEILRDTTNVERRYCPYIYHYTRSALKICESSVGAFGDNSAVSVLAVQREDGSKSVQKRFYFDGLDEVPSQEARTRIVNLIHEQQQKDPNLMFVLTARDYVVGADLDWIPRVSLDDFNDAQVSELVAKWLEKRDRKDFFGQLGSKPGMKTLLRVPLLATLTILIYRQTHNLPGNKTRLYETVVDLMISGWDIAKGIPRVSRLTSALKLAIVRRVAWSAHRGKMREFSRGLIAGELVNLNLKERIPVDMVLTELLENGMLHRAGDQYQFPHLSFQEYLAARDLLGDPRGRRLAGVLEKFLCGDEWWREVLEFYINLVGRQEEIYEWIERGERRAKDAPKWVIEERAGVLRSITSSSSSCLE